MVVFQLALCALALQAATFTIPDVDRIAGWYHGHGTRVLVTWGPRGGYRLLDFDGARFHSLARKAADLYEISGGAAWKGGEFAVTRTRTGAIASVRITTPAVNLQLQPAREAPFDVQEVRFRSGDTVLGAILLIPRLRKLAGKTGGRLREQPMRLPGAVVIHGSGASDRDNVWALTFAHSLARAGIVTLFPDKRGSGASEGDWRTTDLQGLARDALAGVDTLRQLPQVDGARIGLVGLSQGGLVAPIAATLSPGIAFVVSVSAAPVPLFEQMEHELRQDLLRAKVPPEGIEAIVAVARRAAAYSRTQSDADWRIYLDALKALETTPFGKAAAMFPKERTDWRWAWWKSVGDVDPLPAWTSYTGPRLAIFGAEDEQDNVPVRESVRRLTPVLRPETESSNGIRVFPNTGHTLADPARGWVDTRILAYLTDWILAAVGGLERPHRLQ